MRKKAPINIDGACNHFWSYYFLRISMTEQIAIRENFKYLLSRRITKDNRLVNAQAPLTAMQYQLFSACLATLPYDCESFTDTSITINQILGKERLIASDYANVRDAAFGLVDSSIKIKQGKHWAGIALFSYIKGCEGSNVIQFKLNDALKGFVLGLKSQGNFTTHKYGYMTYLRKSMYAMRLYEMLKQYLNIGYREFFIDDLRELLILEGKYKLTNEFKRAVIEPAVKLINKTDLVVETEFIKKGRKITHVAFTIKDRYKQPLLPSSSE